MQKTVDVPHDAKYVTSIVRAPTPLALDSNRKFAQDLVHQKHCRDRDHQEGERQ
jgi:hypothetical protein